MHWDRAHNERTFDQAQSSLVRWFARLRLGRVRLATRANRATFDNMAAEPTSAPETCGRRASEPPLQRNPWSPNYSISSWFRLAGCLVAWLPARLLACSYYYTIYRTLVVDTVVDASELDVVSAQQSAKITSRPKEKKARSN